MTGLAGERKPGRLTVVDLVVVVVVVAVVVVVVVVDLMLSKIMSMKRRLSVKCDG